MKKLLTVTVSIPAYNEEKNIETLIRSVLGQRKKNFKLDQILVACDGSEDRTPEIVRKLSKKNPEICLLWDKGRKGKIFRLLQIYKKSQSDIVIIFDGDILIKDYITIEKIVLKFYDKSVA